MKHKKNIAIAIGIGIVALMVVRLAVNKKTNEERTWSYDKTAPISVKTDTVALVAAENTRTFAGTFEPDKETKPGAEVQGKINSILVDVGSYVQKGQTLIQLDNSLLKLQLESANIQIKGLEADVERYTTLVEAEAVQGIQLEKSQLALESAKVQRATLQEQIRKSTIRAPFSGVVTAKLSEIGSFAAPGMPLLQLTDISTLRFTANISENDLKYFAVGDEHELRSDVMPEQTFRGKVIMIGSKANIGSSFPVQLSIRNSPGAGLRSGMFGKVIIQNDTGNDKIVIPSAAVSGSDLQPQVYVVRDGKAHLQNIVVSERYENKAVVSQGLSVGDVLVTSGFINLFEGANVQIN